MESRELIVGYGQGLRTISRLGRDGNMIDGQGIVEDVTCGNSDRDHN
jgi:hypothetical protein